MSKKRERIGAGVLTPPGLDKIKNPRDPLLDDPEAIILWEEAKRQVAAAEEKKRCKKIAATIKKLSEAGS